MIHKIKRLKELINDRTVVIMLHGKSIQGLENIITELKDKNFCYTSLNYFDLMQDHILDKIDRNLDYVFDTAGIRVENRQHYTVKRRVPRLQRFFSRTENSLLLTNKGMLRDTTQQKYGEFLKEYDDRILLLDSLNIDLINVPNSACLLIGVTLLARAKRIVICGMDGFKGKPSNSVVTYYKQDLYYQHQKDAFGSTDISHLNGDTENFQLMTKKILESYCDLLEIDMPEIYNCSPDSLITIFPKITYEQLKEMK